MFRRYLISNKTLISVNSFTKNFGFLASKANPTHKKLDEIETLEQLQKKLIIRQLGSRDFYNNASKTLNALSLTAPTKSLSFAPGKEGQSKISRFYFLMSDSLKYMSNTLILDVFKMVEQELFSQSKWNKTLIEKLLESLTFVISQGNLKGQELEYCIEKIHTLLEQQKKELGVKLYIYLIQCNNYYEPFEQNYLYAFEAVLFNSEQKRTFYAENIVSFDVLSKFVKEASHAKSTSPYLFKICESFDLPLEVRQSLENNLLKSSSSENDKEIIGQNDQLPFDLKIKSFISSFGSREEGETKLIADFNSDIENYFSQTDQIPAEELSQIIEQMPLLKKVAPKSLYQQLLQRIIDHLMANMDIVKSLEFRHLIFLILNLNAYLTKFSGKNITMVALTRQIASRLTNQTDVTFVLPLLLNYGIIPKEIIDRFADMDAVDKNKLSNIELMYYITTYVRLYAKVSGYNKLIFNGLRIIDDLLLKIHSKLSFEEKCLLILQTKQFSSHNRNYYLIKPVCDNLEQIPRNLFAGVINNAINSCYFLLDKESILAQISKQIPLFDYRELIILGKALIWQDMGDEDFWMRFFHQLNVTNGKPDHNNTIWICDLYQIIYSLKTRDESLYKKILAQCSHIEFEQIEKIYFSRPKLATNEELTFSEFEIEQALASLGFQYERQVIIGIHRVDFVIQPNIIVELYGRHHFTERKVLNASSLWKEKQLIKLGYKVVGIVLQDWNELQTIEKKIQFLDNKIRGKEV